VRHIDLQFLCSMFARSTTMIVGIGTDVVEVERIRRALDHPRTGVRFRDRVFTPGEVDYCLPRAPSAESFAARFAAKEAVMKALGRGFGEGIAWREIEVLREAGRPVIILHGKTRERADELGVTRWHLSLTHTTMQAVAFVVAERI
jgi:holo-[acyl-carrier protein] synthase